MHRAARKKQYEVGREKELAQHKIWRDANPEKVRTGALKLKYGITLEQYNLLLQEQAACCKICGATSERNFDVDHCHIKGNVRGLLCRTCNTSLGGFRDNVTLLQRAIEYLSNGDRTVDTDVSKLVAAYRQLRDKKGQIESAVKAKVAPISEMMEKIEARLMQLADAQKVTSFKTADGTAYKYKASSVRVKDRPSFLEYVKAHDAWELLPSGASKSEVIALQAQLTAEAEAAAQLGSPLPEMLVVPGIEFYNEFKMGFRAPTK